jgi:hypothetical protein
MVPYFFIVQAPGPCITHQKNFQHQPQKPTSWKGGWSQYLNHGPRHLPCPDAHASSAPASAHQPHWHEPLQTALSGNGPKQNSTRLEMHRPFDTTLTHHLHRHGAFQTAFTGSSPEQYNAWVEAHKPIHTTSDPNSASPSVQLTIPSDPSAWKRSWNQSRSPRRKPHLLSQPKNPSKSPEKHSG